MALISVSSNDIINIDVILNQLNSTKIENHILKQKIKTLSNLCQQHKSKYEQIKAEWQYKYNQANQTIQNQYKTEINSLKTQIKNQKIKLDAMQQNVDSVQQHSMDTNNKRNAEILKYQQKIRGYIRDLENTKLNETDKDKRIESLQKGLSNKNAKIHALENKLTKQYEQYIPYPSPTLKVTKSCSYSNMSIAVESAVTSSIEESINVKYYNHDTPISSTKTHIIKSRARTAIKYRKINENVKWTDMMQNSKPPPIDNETKDEESSDKMNDIITPNNTPILPAMKPSLTGFLEPIDIPIDAQGNIITPFLRTIHNDMLNGITPISAVSQSQILSNKRSFSSYFLRNSETEISRDDDINENSESNY